MVLSAHGYEVNNLAMRFPTPFPVISSDKETPKTHSFAVSSYMVQWSCRSLLWADGYGEEANNLMKQLLISNQQVLFFSSALIMRNQEECSVTQGRISLPNKITSARPQGTSDGHFHRTASPMVRGGNAST